MYIYLISGLILVLICCILYNVFHKEKKVEHFDDIKFQFLTPKEAYQTITKSNYFDHFDTVNQRARHCKNVSHCYLKYKKEMLLIDPMEARSIKWLVELLMERIRKHKPKLANLINIKLKFAKFGDLEGNMPHTHDDVIYFPATFYEEVWDKFQKFKNHKGDITTEMEDNILEPHGTTFIHELTHILQRRFSHFFKKFYQNDWGFISINRKNIQKGGHLFDRNRTNPDALDIGWIWKTQDKLSKKRKDIYYLLLAIFTSDQPSSVTSAETNIYTLEPIKGGDGYNVVKSEPINQNFNYIDYFGQIQNNYHPNEISAEYMGYYIQEQIKNKKTDIKKLSGHRGYQLFSKFIESFLWF